MQQVLTLNQRPSTANFNQNTNKLYYIPFTSSLSPQILLANCMSLGRIVTYLVCIVHRFMSSIS